MGVDGPKTVREGISPTFHFSLRKTEEFENVSA
jgi:hypothetical protein